MKKTCEPRNPAVLSDPELRENEEETNGRKGGVAVHSLHQEVIIQILSQAS